MLIVWLYVGRNIVEPPDRAQQWDARHRRRQTRRRRRRAGDGRDCRNGPGGRGLSAQRNRAGAPARGAEAGGGAPRASGRRTDERTRAAQLRAARDLRQYGARRGDVRPRAAHGRLESSLPGAARTCRTIASGPTSRSRSSSAISPNAANSAPATSSRRSGGASTSLDQAFADERTRPNGTVLEVRRNPVPSGGFVSIYADVTEQRRAQALVELARARLTDAIESISDGFALWDKRRPARHLQQPLPGAAGRRGPVRRRHPLRGPAPRLQPQRPIRPIAGRRPRRVDRGASRSAPQPAERLRAAPCQRPMASRQRIPDAGRRHGDDLGGHHRREDSANASWRRPAIPPPKRAGRWRRPIAS